MSGFSFLALAAEVEGAGVLPVEEGVADFSAFSLGFSFSLDLSGSRSLGGSGRGPVGTAEEVDVDVEVEVRLEWETDVLVCAGLDEAKEDEEEGLLGNPDVGKLGEGTLAPGMFRMFVGFGGVKAGTQENRNRLMLLNNIQCFIYLSSLFVFIVLLSYLFFSNVMDNAHGICMYG